MRFFHDQLKYVVRSKFLTLEWEAHLHNWLIKFYLSCIEPQLTENPGTPPPAYYDHCLQQLVYHQIQLLNIAATEPGGMNNLSFMLFI